MNRSFLNFAAIIALLALSSCAFGPKPAAPITPVAPTIEVAKPLPPKPRIALALGGGAARGFAHIGVIKALEAQDIVPDVIVGTSAGAVVGAMYDIIGPRQRYVAFWPKRDIGEQTLKILKLQTCYGNSGE